MAPPGVEAVALLKEAQGVDEAGVEEGLKAGAFLGSVAFFAFVGLGAGEVVWSVGHVEVAAEDDRFGEAGAALDPEFAGLEAFAVLEEGGVPMIVAEGNAAEVVFGVGGVDGDEVKF